MIKWQYTSVVIEPPETVQDVLSSLGKSGWEAWHMDTSPTARRYRIFLKRQLMPDGAVQPEKAP